MNRKGRIILLNGTSSAGKSTLAQALRTELEPQFCYYSSDQLADAGFRQLEPAVRWRRDKNSSTDFTDQYRPLQVSVSTFSWINRTARRPGADEWREAKGMSIETSIQKMALLFEWRLLMS